jgi:hypothetical protein
VKTSSSSSSVMIPDEKPKGRGLGWKAGIALILVVIAFVGAAYLGISYVTAEPNVKTTPYNGYFIDVNGDGLLDYVASSEVIINTGQINLTPTP